MEVEVRGLGMCRGYNLRGFQGRDQRAELTNIGGAGFLDYLHFEVFLLKKGWEKVVSGSGRGPIDIRRVVSHNVQSDLNEIQNGDTKIVFV